MYSCYTHRQHNAHETRRGGLTQVKVVTWTLTCAEVRGQLHLEDMGILNVLIDENREIETRVVLLCLWSEWLSGQMVVRRFPWNFLSIFVKIRSLFSLSLMKLIDISLFLPFVIVWKGLNCITCKWRDLIFAHYLFISENEQNISGSRNEGGGAGPDGERQTIRETEKKCGVKGSWQHSIFYFFGLYWLATIFPFTTPILVCVWWVEGNN